MNLRLQILILIASRSFVPTYLDMLSLDDHAARLEAAGAALLAPLLRGPVEPTAILVSAPLLSEAAVWAPSSICAADIRVHAPPRAAPGSTLRLTISLDPRVAEACGPALSFAVESTLRLARFDVLLLPPAASAGPSVQSLPVTVLPLPLPPWTAAGVIVSESRIPIAQARIDLPAAVSLGSTVSATAKVVGAVVALPPVATGYGLDAPLLLRLAHPANSCTPAIAADEVEHGALFVPAATHDSVTVWAGDGSPLPPLPLAPLGLSQSIRAAATATVGEPLTPLLLLGESSGSTSRIVAVDRRSKTLLWSAGPLNRCIGLAVPLAVLRRLGVPSGCRTTGIASSTGTGTGGAGGRGDNVEARAGGLPGPSESTGTESRPAAVPLGDAGGGGVAFASSFDNGKLVALRLADGAKIASEGVPGCDFVAAWAEHPSSSAAFGGEPDSEGGDNGPALVFASACLQRVGHTVAIFRWDGARFYPVDDAVQGAVTEALSPGGFRGGWLPLAVVPPAPGDPHRRSHLVVGGQQHPELRVFALPGLALVHRHVIRWDDPPPSPAAAAAENWITGIRGLAADPAGSALAVVVCGRSPGSVIVLPWPLPGMAGAREEGV